MNCLSCDEPVADHCKQCARCPEDHCPECGFGCLVNGLCEDGCDDDQPED